MLTIEMKGYLLVYYFIFPDTIGNSSANAHTHPVLKFHG